MLRSILTLIPEPLNWYPSPFGFPGPPGRLEVSEWQGFGGGTIVAMRTGVDQSASFARGLPGHCGFFQREANVRGTGRLWVSMSSIDLSVFSL